MDRLGLSYLSVHQSVQDEEQDKGDETVDDEVEVYEIILHIDCVQAKRSWFDLPHVAGIFSVTHIIIGFFKRMSTFGGNI